MKAGDRIRITAPITFYHHPHHRNEPFEAMGMEGVIADILTDWKGRPISPNYTIIVEFQVEGAKRPFKAHVREEEVEVVEPSHQ